MTKQNRFLTAITLPDCVLNAAGGGVSRGEAWVPHVGAVLVDLTARLVHQEDAADSKPAANEELET